VGLCGNAGTGGNWSNRGQTWGRSGFEGVESGITDPFLGRPLQGVGSLKWMSTGDTCLLEYGDWMTCGV
jgi:hypothetical protein